MSNPGPNPQLNLALSIVAPVIALIAVAVLYFTKPVPVSPADPTPVNTAAAKLPDATVSLTNQLPGGSSAAGGVGGGPSVSPGGPSFGGPPGGLPRGGKPMPGSAGGK
jgi:hypothetical protein